MTKQLHVYVFLYVLLLKILPNMYSDVITSLPKHAHEYIIAQNFDKINVNVVKASLLLSSWPFLAILGPFMMVNSGAFSMLCFSIACRTNYTKTLEATSKIFWFNIFNAYSIPTPTIFAVNSAGRIDMWRRIDKASIGISKPDNGMYGHNVHEDTICNFCINSNEGEIFQEMITTCKKNKCTFRLCTLNTIDSIRIISIFKMSICEDTTDISVWKRIRSFGKKLINLHCKEFKFAPLVGWDILLRDNGSFVVLEGNLGGNVAMHLIPSLKKHMFHPGWQAIG